MLTNDNKYKEESLHTAMTSDLVGVRLPAPLAEQVESISKAEGYTSTQEFIRETLRDRVKEYYRQQTLREFDRLAGSLKGKKIKPLTRDERDAIARELYPTELDHLLAERMGNLKDALSVEEARKYAKSKVRQRSARKTSR